MHRFSPAGLLLILLVYPGRLTAQEAAEVPIRLKSGRVPPIQQSSAYSGRFHFILQFNTPPGPAEQAVLEQRGAKVISYVPENAWICTIPYDFDWSDLELSRVAPIDPSNKLSQLILEDSPALVEFHSDVELSEARNLLLRSGLEILEHPDLAPSTLMVRGPLPAIESLAGLDEVAYILPASDALLAGEPVVACLGGTQSTVPAAANLAARFGEGWDGPGLGQARINYWLGALSPALDPTAQRAEIARALGQWSSVAAIQFSAAAAASQPRSLDIRFTERDHGDGFRFDGRGGALAHTFYPPPNAEPIAGDIHFDIEEPWRIGLDIDLFSVALHETGHALGLGHNDDPNSVMYPYYRRVNALRPADITEIRKLYASTTSTTEPPVAPPQPPPTPQPPSTDKTPPALSISSPAATTSSTSAATLIIRGIATDNNSVASVLWQSAGSSGAATGLPQFTTPPIPLNYGINRFTVRARDAAGNESYRSFSVTRR